MWVVTLINGFLLIFAYRSFADLRVKAIKKDKTLLRNS
tara:strand:- start:718 stop:831 length:114 start_codon:yes stop_codon:yes gene_type:complete